MTHQDAIENMAVEHYLLGELSGEPRDRFEEHLFDCELCAADLQAGVLLLEAARVELQAEPRPQAAPHLQPVPRLQAVSSKPRRSSLPLAWLWQPWVLAPALAACLAFIVYQSAVVVPGIRAELAESQAPAVFEPFVLANAGARGEAVAKVHAPRHGFYLLSVDIPPAANASAYRCSLYSPAGALVWHVDVSAKQAHDAVTIKVPVMTAQEGMNELRVQSLSSTGPDESQAVIARYRYQLKFEN